MERGFYLLVYDIADDKRRLKIAKACESVAERVQFSVFEAYLTSSELQKLVKRTGKVMKKEEDSLRVYLICAACKAKISVYGVGSVTPAPGVVVV
jgi:CRISPR-associated protein Cas2